MTRQKQKPLVATMWALGYAEADNQPYPPIAVHGFWGLYWSREEALKARGDDTQEVRQVQVRVEFSP